MGSGTSRGKRVAPACVSEVSVTQTTTPKENKRPFKPLHAILRNGAQSDCHSEGHDSDFSREDDDMDGELDTVLADYEEPGRKNQLKKAAIRSKTYGLCHFSQKDDEDLNSGETRGSSCGSRLANKRSNGAFKNTAASSGQLSSSSQGFLTRVALLEAGPTTQKQQTFGKSHSSSVATPVILYDGSEEELMDTIEREFS
ncbi:uncharacterized protein [Antennarius striatus]|uniref:uncharacterized protein n=1 Tax=Antennarius striatus TaxID=241820 RepID=UPI0035B23710